ncbi:hypothetical protein C5167_051125 [Papaver somniferum]|uniref:Major facilitator superfamily (MFS) profile domain-containing protein n=1 Tax=Papaver somniferum TaxID=3469 RepID=A0A4Y7KTY7_PAPSO|nr:protein NRT1/ PTR FAMILY 1.2-like [Papaver somniferum]RZC75648.1 hypothetical protein C5167_051125 [Papaver somniferum]
MEVSSSSNSPSTSTSSTSTDPNRNTHELQQMSKQKGGLITLPFIIANEAFEKVASYGLLPNMILYLMKDYHMTIPTGTSVLSIWSGVTNFTPIIGAFFSDSYLGRFWTITFGSIASLLGMTLLWFTAVFPQTKPPHCELFSKDCRSSTAAQLSLLFSSFILMSIGAGGIRACSISFGADQLHKKDNQSYDRLLQNFFNWYYASAGISVVLALTVIVYIQDKFGWKVGFGVPAILMFISAASFIFASSYYIKVNANKSLFSGFAHVIAASVKNKHFVLPPEDEDGCYHHYKDSILTVPTQKLRFLNKACMITDHDKDLNPNGSASNPWRLCTVDQVEEFKSLLKVMPIWSTGIMLGVALSQSTLPILQANSMDRHITSKFQIPAGSFGTFVVISLAIWVGIYDRLLLPLLVKFTGRPYGLSFKELMGIGLVFSILSLATSAIVEGIRRKTAIREGLSGNPQGIVHMSAMWLIPQNCLLGLAEAFNAIGQTEFYYSECPKSMGSIATSLNGLCSAVGSLIVGLLINIVDDITKRGGKNSWVPNNINNGHYDYYYWLLTILSSINLVYFLVCCWAYGPTAEERLLPSKEVEEEENQDELKELKEKEEERQELIKSQTLQNMMSSG